MERRTWSTPFLDAEFEAATAEPEPEADDECGCSAAAFEAEEPAFDGEAWSGTADQVAFREAVLAEHVARTRRRRGAPLPDLPSTALDTIPGTQVRTARATAAAAGRLLAAANADLARAQAAGDADALNTVRLSATSGYRGSEHQRDLWRQYFGAPGGYYDQTRTAREALPGGAHGRAAIDYLLRPTGAGGFGIGGRIAAPGYSNHQNGIAVDWWQERRRGHAVLNRSGRAHRARWRATWFHRWLLANAAAHGFRPLATEEWHWEYRGTAVSPVPAPVVPTSGGRLWAFDAKAWPTRVAIYRPAAAKTGAVTIVVYAHGLLAPCGVPKQVPEGVITDKPFGLDRLVERSGQPVVLVAPSMQWSRTVGAAVWPRSPTWHPLGHPAALAALLDEVLQELARDRGGAAPGVARVVAAGHSRAYDFLEPLAASHADAAMQRGALAHLHEVWAFDTTYGGSVPRWQQWLAADPALQVHVRYRAKGGTKDFGDSLAAAGHPRLHVRAVGDDHCDVPARHLPDLLALPAPQHEAEDAIDPEAEFEDPEAGFDDAEIIGNTDSRLRVTDMRSPPQRWICALDLMVENPNYGQPGQPKWRLLGRGTGTLIGPRHVLTARHVVERDGSKPAPTRIVVSPGRNGSNTSHPQGSFVSTRWHRATPFRWPQQKTIDGKVHTVPIQHHDDYALLVLDREVPAGLGWWGRDAGRGALRRVEPARLDGAPIAITGYPGDRVGDDAIKGSTEDKLGTIERRLARWWTQETWASTAWSAHGTMRASADSTDLQHDVDTFKGQSGAPVCRADGTRLDIVGVHSGVRETNLAVRVTRRMLRELCAWIEASGTPARIENDALVVEGTVPTREFEDDLEALESPDDESMAEALLDADDPA